MMVFFVRSGPCGAIPPPIPSSCNTTTLCIDVANTRLWSGGLIIFLDFNPRIVVDFQCLK
jgi:hypothetical protein